MVWTGKYLLLLKGFYSLTLLFGLKFICIVKYWTLLKILSHCMVVFSIASSVFMDRIFMFRIVNFIVFLTKKSKKILEVALVILKMRYKLSVAIKFILIAVTMSHRIANVYHAVAVRYFDYGFFPTIAIPNKILSP